MSLSAQEGVSVMFIWDSIEQACEDWDVEGEKWCYEQDELTLPVMAPIATPGEQQRHVGLYPGVGLAPK